MADACAAVSGRRTFTITPTPPPKKEVGELFQFSAAAASYVPTRTFTVLTKDDYQALLCNQNTKIPARPGSTKNWKKTGLFVPIPVPVVSDPEKIRRDVSAFIVDGRHFVDRPKSPVHPAIIRSKAYQVRKGVDALVKEFPEWKQKLFETKNNNNKRSKREGRGNPTNDSPATSHGSPNNGTRTRRNSKSNVIDLEIENDPFAMEILRKSASIGSVPSIQKRSNRTGALRGVPGSGLADVLHDQSLSLSNSMGSSYSLGLKAELETSRPDDAAYYRKIKSNFNKLSESNVDKIVHIRLLSLLGEYLLSHNYQHVIEHVTQEILESVSHNLSKSGLIAKCAFSLLLFFTQRERHIPFEGQTFRYLMVKSTREMIESTESALATEAIDGLELEVINFRKDKLRGLLTFAWHLTARGVIPPKSMLKHTQLLVDTLGGDINTYEKTLIHLQSQKEVFHLLGQPARSKCERTWQLCILDFRKSIAKNINQWDEESRSDASRFGVLLEIGEAEMTLMSTPDSSGSPYPIRDAETLDFESRCDPSLL